MAEKKSVVFFDKDLDVTTIDKVVKKGAYLPNAETSKLEEVLKSFTECVTASELNDTIQAPLIIAENTTLDKVLEFADRRTLVVIVGKNGVGFSGLAIDKVGTVDRAVNELDIAVTIATIVDLELNKECTGAIIYQIFKNPNLKLDEIKKLKEALARMESVVARDNREPWDKHDCA